MLPLISFLEQVPDWRRAQGQRIKLSSFLEMIVLAGLNGKFGIREISRFIKNNEDFFIDRYNLQHGVPGQTVIFKNLSKLEFEKVVKALKKWVVQYVPQDTSDFWISIDGKSIKSTITNYHSDQQDFIAIVSAYSNHLGACIDSESFSNKQESEGSVARRLIERLELKGVTFTLDALHCQKKPLTSSWIKEMIT